jgi:hypothetical protein
VNLVIVPDQESVVGDLVEEFFHHASQSGIIFARRWYWRQVVTSIAHLVVIAFRRGAWTMAAVVIGGYLLCDFVGGLPDKILSVVTDRYLVYWSNHFPAYLWVLKAMLLGHLLASLFVGCVVALAARGREMVATMTLSILLVAMAIAACLFTVVKTGDVWFFGALPWYFADRFAIVIGGIIVRTRRSAATLRYLGA